MRSAQEHAAISRMLKSHVLPVLKKAQADSSAIEAVTALVSPQAANIERAGFAVFGVLMGAAARCRRSQL